jgi:DnaK suppressor protein
VEEKGMASQIQPGNTRDARRGNELTSQGDLSLKADKGLEQRKAALLAKAREISQHSSPREDLTIEREPDLLDYLQAMSDRVIVADAMSRDFAVLRDVQEALRAMETGEYGECRSCGNVIPARRLDAIPWARLCVPCQQAEESQQNPLDLEDAA